MTGSIPPTISAPARRRMGLSSRLDRLSEPRFALLLFIPAALLVGLFVIPPILSVFGMSIFGIAGRWRRPPYHSLDDAEMERLREFFAGLPNLDAAA